MLIDEILDSDKVYVKDFGESEFKNALASSFVIKSQNVVDYLFQSGKDEPFNVAKDFPNVAPSMPRMWIEWRMPRFLNSKGKVEELGMSGHPFGVFIEAEDLHNDPERMEIIQQKAPGVPLRWYCVGRLFTRDLSSVPFWYGSLKWFVKEQGEIILPDDKRFWETNPASTELLDLERAGGFFASMFEVPFLTLTFMHCKNVEVLPGEKWPDKLQKSREKRGKKPLLRWHTLVIDPAKKIIASANGGDSRLTPKALHICRGHFKDFSDKGLFGKYHGMYWWPMHARGSAEHGIVGKDYLVKPDLREKDPAPSGDPV